MCRLACFPPGFGRDKALEILRNFEGANTHGVGSAYVKDGKFQVEKAPVSLTELLQSGYNFLGHMGDKFKGWTIAHLRLATHGAHTAENTHPFVVNDWCLVHNGVFSEEKYYRRIITKIKNPDGSDRKLNGNCDSEVATQLLDIFGPQDFTQEMDRDGVFIGLHRSGQLYAMKTSGDLSVYRRSNDTELIASSLTGIERYSKKKYELKNGCWLFGADGKYISGAEKKDSWSTGWQGTGADCYRNGYHAGTTSRGANCGTGCTPSNNSPTNNTPMTKEQRDEVEANSFHGLQHLHD
jgi:predicted glutamine amidotransferase